MDDPEFKVTVKHQMFGPELNQIWFCKFNVGIFLVRQFIFLTDYTQTNLKIRYLPVTNTILWSTSILFVHRTLMFYSS